MELKTRVQEFVTRFGIHDTVYAVVRSSVLVPLRLLPVDVRVKTWVVIGRDATVRIVTTPENDSRGNAPVDNGATGAIPIPRAVTQTEVRGSFSND